MQLISTIENLRTETTRALTNCITGRQHEDWHVANCAKVRHTNQQSLFKMLTTDKELCPQSIYSVSPQYGKT